jgi:type II secretion system protein N
MKRFVAILTAAALFLLAFGWGFALNFPDAAVTRAIEASVNTSPLLAIGLAPVRLTLTGLRSDRLTVRKVGAPDDPPLLTLTDVRLPYRPALFQGAPLQAALGSDGRVNGFFAWDGSDLTVNDLSARLEDLPLPYGVPGMTVKGRITLSGHFSAGRRPGSTRAELPDGQLRGRVEAVEVSGLNVAGTALPVTRLQDVEISLRTGRTVQIERMEAHGDLQGTVQGSVVPNLDRIQDSRLSLTVAASLRPAWIQDTGALRPVLEGFFPGGRIEGTLGGTAGQPAWSATRSRR